MTIQTLKGAQRPTFQYVPKDATDFRDGDDAIELSSSYGLELDDWQAHMLRVWLSRDESGELIATAHGASVPRQNGKNGAIEGLELFEMIALGRKIIHTAHQVKTAKKGFARILGFFETDEFPELRRLVKSVRRTNGQEGIFLTNGGSIEFIARSKKSGRGFTGDTLILDEAQDLSDEDLEALQPMISAAPSGESRTVSIGTPPSPEQNGEVFQRLYELGHSNTADRITWMEWAADENDDASDRKTWAKTNPAIGTRLGWNTIADEYQLFSLSSFQRERLGVWNLTEAANPAIDEKDWNSCAIDENGNYYDIFHDGSELSLGVDISPSRKQATLVGSGMGIDGLPWIDVIESRSGSIDWLIPMIVEKCDNNSIRAVVIDAGSPAGTLIDPLTRAGIKVTTVGTNLVIQAVGGFYDRVVTHKLRHKNQAVLNSAALSAGKRNIGQSWGWARAQDGTDITPIVASTLALFGLEWTKAEAPKVKKKKRRVVFGATSYI